MSNLPFDKPIVIQKVDEATEKWADVFNLHAKVNKTGGSEYVSGGANQSKSNLTFEVRYFKSLEDIDFNRGLYRIVYRNHIFNITDYDDYLQKHETVKLVGVSV